MRPEVEILRKNVYDFILGKIFINVAPGSTILEVGPMQIQWTPIKEYYVDTREFFLKNHCNYISCDVDENSGVDIKANILDIEDHINKNSLDIIICLEVLEHTSKIWELSRIFKNLLKENGKIFISSPFYFYRHAPFPDYWRISEDGFSLLFGGDFDLEIEPLVIDDDRKPIHYTLIGNKK
ncbi:MAG: hypothetical protein EPN39_04660 [Chitinophagaceae bacterium]|nr:MAG: hypothetical protein EPN39_04660 [Chitinophagaceae bacterium]